ncbi:hypothetical protein [Candidatus Reidiella endopervernicosa]|uniref:Uncharacterized protein n=1 Tax=Candidatus Reidiella endopervernicosa TaxID=2738883 RepID=A0A6N0HSM4_9GAMM|nr:hypothetical protein [Candidatus Reidiella endopervernicosa]QKQ25383.1 hypothetical protein HUE57_03070 [Candidatus Reidiella endopervernicosa]
MISAGDAVQVDQRIYTDSGDISIYAGAGGIAQNQTIDPEADILLNTYAISDIDAREGNIWLQAVGDITPSVVRTGGNLTILSTAGEISGGQIQESRSGILGYDEFDDPIISKFGYPDEVDLAGYSGITDFTTGHANNIDALSANGSVTNLAVSNPSHLMVIAKDDIVMGGQVGNGEFYAGRDTDLGGMVLVGDVIAMAGRDVTIGTTASLVEFPDTSVTAVVDISVQADSLTLSAGYDPYATLDGVTVAGVAVPSWSPSWTPSAVSDVLVENMIWIEGTGGMSVTAAHDIILPDTHVSYSLADADATIDPLQLTQNFTLAAGNDVSLDQIETTGAVSITSTGGDIDIGATIGYNVSVETPERNLWNPTNLGVASLLIQADSGSITMYEARAEGAISIAAPAGQVTFLR